MHELYKSLNYYMHPGICSSSEHNSSMQSRWDELLYKNL